MFQRCFSTTRTTLSHIGSSPVFLSSEVKTSSIDLLIPKVIPKGAQKITFDRLFTIEGPKGEISLPIPEFISFNKNETTIDLNISQPKNKIQKSLWGTYRALINNAVVGVTEGHSSTLRFVGTGYRCMLEEINGQKWVKMKVGRCNLEGLPIPKGITCSTPSQTLLVLEGADKQKLNLFAASLRNMRPPEPYKGKGVYLNGETIKLKAKKVK
ncbi:mitochondrial 54S ribosomal protein YmL16 [Martiniozyma asiatica (nom. inval.)]|nr:mitochondrial 54S ribosomal protein YmL16 [Martiniozyma asiatica]